MFNELNHGEFVPQREQVLNFHRIRIGHGPYRSGDSSKESTAKSSQTSRSDNNVILPLQKQLRPEVEQTPKLPAKPLAASGANNGGVEKPAAHSTADIDKISGVSDWWSDALLDKFPFLPSQKARAIMHSRMPDLADKDITKDGCEYTLCKKGHSLSIARLIDQLRHDKFKTRESAANKLSQLPEAIFQMEEKLNELKGKQSGDDLEQQTALRHILSSLNARALLRLERDVLSDDRATRDRAYEMLCKKPGHLTSLVPKLREKQEQLEMAKTASESSFLNRLVPAFARMTGTSFDKGVAFQRAIDELVTRCDGVELDKLGRIRKVLGNEFNMEIRYDGNRIVGLRSEWMEQPSQIWSGSIPDAQPIRPLRRSLNVDVNGNACRVWSSDAIERIDSDITIDGRFVPSIQLDCDGTLEIYTTEGRQIFETGLAQGNPAALKYIIS